MTQMDENGFSFGQAEMSLLVRHDEVPPSGKTLHHVAAADQLVDLAKRFNVEEVAGLRFDALLMPLDNGCLQASGKVEGRVRQICGVTLEPVWTQIKQAFSTELQPAEMVAKYVVAEDDFDTELPEAMHHGEADIGELVTQVFAVEIPAYPRAPEARFAGYGQTEEEIGEQQGRPSPFASLAALKDNGDKA